jgi:hypothetical protein
MLTLSIHPETTFTAVSSSGVRASAGIRTACAGRVVVTAVAASAAHAYAASGGPSARSTTAVAPMADACATYPAARTCVGGRRSASDAATGANSAAGMSCAVATIPAVVAPPRSYA